MITNRESGLSALATALTGYAPAWGLHLESNRQPNIRVVVECELETLSDYSILGDWIGKNAKPEWDLPFGPMPYVRASMSSFLCTKKALTAAAANYGSPMMWVEGHTEPPTQPIDSIEWEGTLVFTQSDLEARYQELSPKERLISS